MTDHLALLLEEQLKEQEDREKAGTWKTGVVWVPRLQQKAETEEEQEPAGGEDLPQPVPQTGRSTDSATETEDLREDRAATLDWTARRWTAGKSEVAQAGLRTNEQAEPGQPERLYRTGEEGGPGDTWAVTGGAGWMDRAVRLSLAGLPQLEQEPKMVALEPGTVDQSARRLELRQLDRLVRRDARRFDGGFQLL